MQKILYTILIIALIIVIMLLVSITAINVNYIIAILAEKTIIVEKSIVEYVTIMLTCIALCFTISVVIPYFLSNQIVKKEIEKTVNDIFNRDYKIELNDALNMLERGDADHSRMTALFLQNHKMYIWSIGWVCRSILRYLKCDNIPEQKMYNNIVKMCIPILISDIHRLVIEIKASNPKDLTKSITDRFNSENSESKNSLILRTLTDIIDYRTMSLRHKDKIKILENSEQKKTINLFISLILTTIPKKERINCGEISWFGSEVFSENLSQYETASSNQEIFNTLYNIAKSSK